MTGVKEIINHPFHFFRILPKQMKPVNPDIKYHSSQGIDSLEIESSYKKFAFLVKSSLQ